MPDEQGHDAHLVDGSPPHDAQLGGLADDVIDLVCVISYGIGYVWCSEGILFENEIVGGSIPREFIPAIQKGIKEASETGVLAGYPVRNVKVTLYDGSFHEVDSSEMAFKIAGSMAFKEATAKAGPTLLEPVMNVEVYAPSEFAGDLMGELNSRRGRIGGMDSRGAMTVIRAQVPMAEMLTYEQQLTSATGGRGSFQMGFSHYEEVPSHLQAKIIAAAKAEKGEEVEEEA